MFVVKENSRYTSEQKELYHEAKTEKELFNNFADDCRERNVEELKQEHDSYCEDSEETISFVDYINMAYEKVEISSETELHGKIIFDVWDGSGESALFVYNSDSIDYNEMLNYRYGEVASPKGLESKYFICKK